MTGITIRLSSADDARSIAEFSQPIYVQIYPNEKYGMKPEHFSPAVFNTEDTLEYFRHVFTNHARQRAYVAERPGRIVGTISIEHSGTYYDAHAFYVDPSMQGHGLGKELMQKALHFCTADIPIRAEVAETNLKAIALYRHWGFRVAPELGLSLRHWPEWPEGLHNGYIFMIASRKDLHV